MRIYPGTRFQGILLQTLFTLNMYQILNRFFTPYLVWLQALVLLAVRATLAYGFYEPAKNKWTDINAIVDWFTEMGLPFPAINAYLAAGTEAAGVVLLTLGLFTRFISVPLIVTMIVAIVTVHGENGFPASENGFEIPMYYIDFLASLIVFGAGHFSADYLLARRREVV